jgi:hypothetical protein
LDRATSGPELGHAIQSLDRTLTRLDDITRELQPDIKSLVTSLRETADAAQKTLNSVQGTLGNGSSSGTARGPRATHTERRPRRASSGRRGT